MKKLWSILLVFILIIPLSPKAAADFKNNNEVFRYLKDAFQIQVSLSDQVRTKEEIIDLLSPFFSKDYQQVFLDENLVEEEGKFITYGSDFAFYYVPFFQYSDETKVIYTEDKIYVFEYFPASNEGPVGYADHYEGLLLKKIDGGWKVDQYLYDNIPISILDKAYQPAKKQKLSLFSFIHIRQLFD